MILGCVGSDSNRQSSAYEADELPFLYPAMGAAGGFEPRIQVMNLVSYLQTTTAISEGGVFFRSEPPRPHMKGNENRKVAGGKAENILSQAMRITLENFSFIIQYS